MSGAPLPSQNPVIVNFANLALLWKIFLGPGTRSYDISELCVNEGFNVIIGTQISLEDYRANIGPLLKKLGLWNHQEEEEPTVPDFYRLLASAAEITIPQDAAICLKFQQEVLDQYDISDKLSPISFADVMFSVRGKVCDVTFLVGFGGSEELVDSLKQLESQPSSKKDLLDMWTK